MTDPRGGRRTGLDKAAKQLNYSQPAISHHLARLERPAIADSSSSAASTRAMISPALRTHRVPGIEASVVQEYRRHVYRSIQGYTLAWIA